MFQYVYFALVLCVVVFCDHKLSHNPLKHKVSRLAWCPPHNFVNERARSTKLIKTTLITEIHGQLKTTGRYWGTFLPGKLLARNIHHHIGVMGFDKMYINVIYNDTVHRTPPTVTELYPEEESCVSAWFATGTVEFRYCPYEGPKERWPLNDRGEPDNEKDLYKTLRGINPIYDEIRRKGEADWVMVLDADELLYPINWISSHEWCSHEQPSILELGIQQMLTLATTVVLQTYPLMLRHRGVVRNESDACLLGYGINAEGGGPPCRGISSIIFPVRMWTKYYPLPGTSSTSSSGSSGGAQHRHHMPQLRAKIPSSYAANYIDELNRTEVEEESQYHQWKSIHQVRWTPDLTGPRTMHYGGADTFKIVAPSRDYQREQQGISFEIGHVWNDCDEQCRGLLVKDEQLHDLYVSYQRCMTGLSKPA